jgi:hypothetical protein
MPEQTSTVNLTFAYNIFKILQKDELSYYYKGLFTQTITENLLSLTQSNLEQSNEPTKIKKKVYFIMVESLQNIVKHQDSKLDISAPYSGMFFIQKRGSCYMITSGNIIEVRNINSLRAKLEKINSLDNEKLKDYYLEMLKNGEISEKGGAGLGLIEIAKKSGNKLGFQFKEINPQFSYFYFQTAIDSETPTNNESQFDTTNSLSTIVDLHNLLNKEDVQLIFRGSLTQETLINLISVIRSQFSEEFMMKRTVTLIIELLQNIVKHGYNSFENIEENSGIFIISNKNGVYHLFTGNYIENSKIETLKTRIEVVNELTREELSTIYNKGLFEPKNKYHSNAGLGLIKLRMKVREPFEYNFYQINEQFSFFTFHVIV